MRICVVGGGKVGYYLAKTLMEHGHEPVVIETDMATAKRVANELDIPVIRGDGTSIDSLREADAARCGAMVCVSGKDEVNLVAAQLAKKEFGIPRTVARVNNPKNTQVLKTLGVDIVVSSTHNIARLIEQEVETSAVRHLLSLHGGTASLVQVNIPPSFRYNGHTLAQLPVPEGCVIVSVDRRQETIVPNGATPIMAGDRLLVVATDDALHKLILQWHISLT